MSKKLYLQTTEVSASKTASEIVAVLVQSGAREILTQYDNGKLTGIRFSLEISKQTAIYSLPVKIDPVFKILVSQKPGTTRDTLRQQAERVAWRILLRWIQSELARIEVGMAEIDEVFLSYKQMQDGRTVWEFIQGGGQLALPPALEENNNVKRFPEAK